MIGVITYDTPHRKTQDVLSKLLLYGYTDIHLFVLPWVERKSFVPLFRHRPSTASPISVEEMCKNLKISFQRTPVEELASCIEEKNPSHIMIAGAGLLPEDVPNRFDLLNAHPGFLPNVRGLDALKWAIFDDQPLGVTVHYISAEADEGRLIDRREVPLYFEDTFDSFSRRVYEMEIEMMVQSIALVEEGKAPLTSLTDDRFEAHRRMPHYKELLAMEKFEDLRRKAPSMNDNG